MWQQSPKVLTFICMRDGAVVGEVVPRIQILPSYLQKILLKAGDGERPGLWLPQQKSREPSYPPCSCDHMTWPQPIRGLLPRNKNLVGGKQRVRFTQNFSVLQPSWGLAQRGGAAVSPNRQPAPGVGSGLFSRLAPRALPAAQFLLSITLKSEQ